MWLVWNPTMAGGGRVTITRGLRLVAAGLLTMLMFSSCSNGTGGNPTPTPSSPSPSASATPTPTTEPSPTPSTASEQAAVDAVVLYLHVLDKLGSDPESDLNELNTVATGQALVQWQHDLMQYRIEGWRKVGEQVPAFVGSTPGSSASQWLVAMCIDISEVDLRDAAGVSVKNPDSPPRVLTEFQVDHQITNDTWYVATDEVKATC